MILAQINASGWERNRNVASSPARYATTMWTGLLLVGPAKLIAPAWGCCVWSNATRRPVDSSGRVTSAALIASTWPLRPRHGITLITFLGFGIYANHQAPPPGLSRRASPPLGHNRLLCREFLPSVGSNAENSDPALGPRQISFVFFTYILMTREEEGGPTAGSTTVLLTLLFAPAKRRRKPSQVNRCKKPRQVKRCLAVLQTPLGCHVHRPSIGGGERSEHRGVLSSFFFFLRT